MTLHRTRTTYLAECKACRSTRARGESVRHHVKHINRARPEYKGSEPEGKGTHRSCGSNTRIAWLKNRKGKKGGGNR